MRDTDSADQQPVDRAAVVCDDELVRPHARRELKLAGKVAVVIWIRERRARAPVPPARDVDRTDAGAGVKRQRAGAAANRRRVVAARCIRTVAGIVAVQVRRFARDGEHRDHDETSATHVCARSKGKTTLSRWKIVVVG